MLPFSLEHVCQFHNNQLQPLALPYLDAGCSMFGVCVHDVTSQTSFSSYFMALNMPRVCVCVLIVFLDRRFSPTQNTS